MSATKITYSLPIPDETLKDLWKKEQIELRQKLVLTDDLSDIQLNFQGQVEGLRLVGGVDLSFPTDNDRLALAGLVILEYPSLKVIYEDFQEVEVDLPYIPGFLAFREVKVLLGLVQQLRLNRPELLPQV
ncbi:hypothetical protein K7432_013803 [Basidiobolus ranarum]|uniref:Uncharacterized protein n=1 Tax=Basidiobolus ranarum TaxID=34480 RepID=A0ABR2VQA7_9FUNG